MVMCWKMEKISWNDRVRNEYYGQLARKRIYYLLTFSLHGAESLLRS